jgi:hypothetical protein
VRTIKDCAPRTYVLMLLSVGGASFAHLPIAAGSDAGLIQVAQFDLPRYSQYLSAETRSELQRWASPFYWWRHENMNRVALRGDFARFLEEIASERDGLENSFRERVAAVIGASSEERTHLVARCWSEAMAAERT